MRTWLLLASLGTAALLSPVSNAADARQGRALCYQSRFYKDVVHGCTETIEWGHETGAELAKAYVRRCTAYFDNREFDLALADFNQAVAMEPNKADHYLSRGATYFAMENFPAAIADTTKAILMRPGDADIHWYRGIAYQGNNELELALVDYSEVIRLRPDFARAYNNRGTIYSDLGEYDKALEDYGRALKLDPRHAYAFNNRGNIYVHRDMLKRALSEYDQAPQIDPDYFEALVSRCWVRGMLNQQLDGALADCSRANATHPNDSFVRNGLGLVYFRAGRFADALAILNMALMNKSDDPDNLFVRGLVRQHLGDQAGADADIKAALAILPTIGEYLASYGLKP